MEQNEEHHETNISIYYTRGTELYAKSYDAENMSMYCRILRTWRFSGRDEKSTFGAVDPDLAGARARARRRWMATQEERRERAVTCDEALDRSRPRAIISAVTREDQRWLFPSERRNTEREAKGEGERPAVRGHGMSLVTDLFRGGGERGRRSQVFRRLGGRTWPSYPSADTHTRKGRCVRAVCGVFFSHLLICRHTTV